MSENMQERPGSSSEYHGGFEFVDWERDRSEVLPKEGNVVPTSDPKPSPVDNSYLPINVRILSRSGPTQPKPVDETLLREEQELELPNPSATHRSWARRRQLHKRSTGLNVSNDVRSESRQRVDCEQGPKRRAQKMAANSSIKEEGQPDECTQPKVLNGPGLGLKHNKPLFEGVWEDLFMVTNTFLRSGSTKFKDFLHFCKDIKIMEMFCGVRTLARQLELLEVVISRCKDMWMENISLEKQVSWFYLMCVFFLHQPRSLLEFDARPSRVRVVREDWLKIKAFLLEARSSTFIDVVPLFKLMYQKQAFLNCVMPKPYGLENVYVQSFLRDSEKCQYLDSNTPFPPLSSELRQHKDEIKELFEEYCAAKESLFKEVYSNDTTFLLPDLLSNVKDDFMDELFSTSSSTKSNPTVEDSKQAVV